MKALCADSGAKFISAILKKFFNQQGIAIKYIAQYLHKKKWINGKRMKNADNDETFPINWQQFSKQILG